MAVRSARPKFVLAACLGCAVALFVGAAGAAGAAASTGAASSSTSGDGRLETNISDNGPEYTKGEPEIAVDPTNPKRLFYNLNTFPVPLQLSDLGTRGPDAADSCGSWVSTDRGEHWKKVQVPTNLISDTLGCGDNVAATGPDGTLYAGGITPTYTAFSSGGITVGGQAIVVHGRDVISRSTDWGKTWSKPVVTMSSDAARFAPGGSPIDTFDRPWIVVDQSDGTVYASGQNLNNPRERFVTASTNKAKSFGAVYPIDSSDEYPQSGGGTIAAANGVLAVAYTASAAPGATCPCAIFETSTDHGETFDRHIVPLDGADVEGLRPFLAASPVQEGRYAVAVLDASETMVQVYVTDDSGETWQAPTLVGEDPPNQRFKPWLSFGPSGDLDVVWRTQYPDGSYDVWAATAPPDGQDVAFSAPLKVSSQAAPYPDAYYGGDDFSWIVGDDKYVHVAWGDSRNGPVQAWYGRVPRAAFASPDG